MKIIVRLFIILCGLVVNPAFGSSSHMPFTGSIEALARASGSTSTSIESGVGETTLPCHCPFGHECLSRPYIDFRSPVNGAAYPVGERLEVEAYACNIGPEYSRTMRVSCPGSVEEFDSFSFKMDLSEPGVCQISATAVGGLSELSSDEASNTRAAFVASGSISFSVADRPLVEIMVPLEGREYPPLSPVNLVVAAHGRSSSIANIGLEVRRLSDAVLMYSRAFDNPPPAFVSHAGFPHNGQVSATTGVLSPGEYELRATARLVSGESSESRRSFTVLSPNSAPTISIPLPAENGYTLPIASIPFQIDVSDADGDAVNFAMTLRLKPAGQTEFQLVRSQGWLDSVSANFVQTGIQAGTYRIEVSAEDARGGQSTRSRDIEVSAAPTVQVSMLETPGAPYVAGKPLKLIARATVSSGPIERVVFFLRTGNPYVYTQIGEATPAGSETWEYVWSPVPGGVAAGSHVVLAYATPRTGSSQWSMPRQYDVVANEAPKFILKSEKPARVAEYFETGPYGQTYKSFLGNVFEPGQQIELAARFSDQNRNITRIEFYLLAAGDSAANARLIAARNYPVPHSGSTYDFTDRVHVTADMVSHRMQRIYAIATDELGRTDRSTDAPVAIRNAANTAQACVPSVGNCSPWPNQVHRVPGHFMSAWYDGQVGASHGVAGESYFDTSFLLQDPPVTNARGDDVNFVCSAGSWGSSASSCSIRGREVGTYQAYSLEFQLPGVYEVKLCFANQGAVRESLLEDGESGRIVNMQFETVDENGRWLREAHGRLSAGGSAEELSRALGEQGLSLPAGCPSELRTISILQGNGDPVVWPAGFRSRMRLVATPQLLGDLMWIALVRSEDSSPTRFVLNSPQEGGVYSLRPDGSMPVVTLDTDLQKPRPGGLVTYDHIPGWSIMQDWTVVEGASGLPADGNRQVQFVPVPDYSNPTGPRRFLVRARLHWEGKQYYAPERGFYVSDGSSHKVEWIGASGETQAVGPGSHIEFRLRAKFLVVGGNQASQSVKLAIQGVLNGNSEQIIHPAVRDQNQAGCPQASEGWQCFTAVWAVPANAAASTEYQVLAVAQTAEAWLTSQTAQARKYRVDTTAAHTPRLAVTAPNDGAWVQPDASLTLRATVLASGSVGSVAFERCPVALGGSECVSGWQQAGTAVLQGGEWSANSQSPSAPLQGALHYLYRVKAVVSWITYHSEPVRVVVSHLPSNQAPTVAWLSPGSAASLSVGQAIELAVNAVDPEGPIQSVEFRASRNGVLAWTALGVVDPADSKRWIHQWRVSEPGNWSITARALDSNPILPGEASAVRTFVVVAQPGISHEEPAATPSIVNAASDGVGATAGTFRVDETGAATYSIPLAVVPGRAGVAPEMALSYSSQAGMGVMGRGWSIAGASAITRCRQTAEAGDVDAMESGSPPLSFNADDRYCLDGQRLMLVVGSYDPAAPTMEFRTEIDGFARIRAFNTDDVNGPNYFVVQAKDGTTSWYGDRISGQGLPFMPANFAPEERTDAALRRNDGSGQAVPPNAPVLSFALARRMDSFGNYIDYRYETSQEQGEQLLRRVEYTGKTALVDQSSGSSAPFAALRFNYEALPANEQRTGWQSGMRVRGSHRLVSVDSLASLEKSQLARQYRLSYNLALSLSGERVLDSIRECSDDSQNAVCYQPTTFGWTRGSLRVDDFQIPTLDYHSRAGVKAHQLGDVDGDGRMDLVWFNNDTSLGGPCSSLGLPPGTQRIFTGFGTVVPGDGNTLPKFGFPVPGHGSAACSLRTHTTLSGAWYLFDYDGDGRDDLMLADREPDSSDDVTSWQIYASRGRFENGQVFHQGQNGGAGLLPTCPRANSVVRGSEADPDAPGCLPVNRGQELLMQLADLNGDGLQDAVYGSPVMGATGQDANVLKFKLMERTGTGLGFSRAYEVDLRLSGNEYLSACAGDDEKKNANSSFSVQECKIRFLDANSRAGRSPTPLDLNGDGRGDLLLQVEVRYLTNVRNATCRAPTLEEATTTSSMWAPSNAAHLARLLASSTQRRSAVCSNEGVHFFTVAANLEKIDHADRSITFNAYQAFTGDHYPPESGGFRGLAQPRPADFNGDGLVDLVFNHPWSDDRIQVFMNTGDGFVDLPVMSGITGRDYIQLLDFDGDGRTDLLHPSGSSHNSVWRMRRGQPEGGVSSNFILPDFWIPGSQAPERLDFHPGRSLYFFADFDGDGKTDVLEVPGPDSSGSQTRLIRSGTSERYKPLAYLDTITNGYGAVTEITYQPLTNGAVYLREPGSRAHSASIGNGSPVQDLLGPMHVVSRVASDAPGLGAHARKSELFYQYRGARMQAGGRGMLGFREMRTIDANFEPGPGGVQRHIVSITEYGLSVTDPETGLARYGFPYVGMPRETRQYRVDAAVPANLRACLQSGPESVAGYCFNAGGHIANANPYFGEPTGTLLSYARNRLNHAVTATGPLGERSVFPYIEASFEAKGNPEHSGAGGSLETLSETVGRFQYETAWGDLESSSVGTANGAGYGSLEALRSSAVVTRLPQASVSSDCAGHPNCLSSVRTINTWLPSSQPQPTAANDRDYWRLGRLDKSTVTHWRKGAHGENASSLTRESRFEYDVTGTTRTGALRVERVAGLSTQGHATAANGSPSELRTVRKRDAYGNVTDTFVCSGDVSDLDCEDASQLLQRPAGSSGSPLTRVHRHTRTTYDSQGRYPEAALAPYFDGTPDGALHALETVQQRDVLGNVLQTSRLNGGTASATYGPLGRQLTSTDSTGSNSVSEFHWCAGGSATGQVAACPSDIGAVFRQTAYVYGGTRSVTYFDRLGREVFALSESFNRYDNNAANDWVGVCKTYDGRGRTITVSEPFFIGNVATSGLRPELSTAVSCASKPSTRTTYDVLDRALTILLPEHAGTTTAMSEMVYSGLQTTTHTRLSRATSPFGTPSVVTLSEVRLHDASGQVLTVTDAEGLEAKYVHDAAGNLTALKRNAGRGEIVSRISYDALGRKTSQVDPDAGTASYAYNAAGELICSQDARGYATITDFDALGRGWRSRTLKTSCASTTTIAMTLSNADASILPTAMAGDHSSVDLTMYDLAGNGIGQVEGTLRKHRVGSSYGGYRSIAGDQGEFWQASNYDSFGRPSLVTTRFYEPNLNGSGLSQREFTQSTTYDTLGRVAITQDATGGVVENMYSAHGFLRRVRDAGQPSLVFWELLETDVRGQTTLDRRHGKVELTQQRQYNEVTGRLARIVTGTWANNQIQSAVQNLSYVFDAQGNLLSRKDERTNGREEAFVYDRLNRLTEARLSGVSPTPGANTTTLTLSYDTLGNICSKNGVGYGYAGPSGCGLNGVGGSGGTGTASPHAVTARGSLGYQYDAAGNMTTTTGGTNGTRTVRFDGAGNADRLSISTQSTSFWYAGGGRYLRLDESSDTPAKLTRYLGGVEWIVRSGGGAEERKRSIGGFLLLTETGNTQAPTRKYRYLLADHLGSTDTLVDENGVVQERMSFDAHGSRRAADSGSGMWASLLPATAHTDINPQINAETTRGFTGHEHVDRMGLIHMNGRLYDPLLGRMLSPDPIVQEPYNAQNLNRYSYVLNNPLSYTDPSGLSFVKKYWRQIVAAVVTIFAPMFAPGIWGAIATGFVSGTIATGSWEGGLWGAFSAGVFFGIGSAFEGVANANSAAVDGVRAAGFSEYAINTVGKTGLTSTQFAGKVLAHAVAGGVMNSMQGGRFGHGVASAGIVQAFSPGVDRIDVADSGFNPSRVMAAALIGGTASVASGGKFSNGALSGAFSRAFNDEFHYSKWDAAYETLMDFDARLSDLTNTASGFGDAVSFGATRKIRSLWGIHGGVDEASFSYRSSQIGGMAIGVPSAGVVFNTGLRLFGGARRLYHYTSIEAAAGIAREGVIRVGVRNLWGRGAYATAFSSPIGRALTGASSQQAVVPVVGGGRFIPTPWPGTFLSPKPVVLP